MTNSNPPDFTEHWRQSLEEWAQAWTALAQPPAEAEQPAEGGKPATTPAEVWKRSMDRWLGAWSGYLEESMARPEFIAATGKALSRSLDVQKPIKDQTEESMKRWLEAVNMPSRNDITRLARQMNDITARLDEMGDRIEELIDAVTAIRGGDTHAGSLVNESGAPLGAGRWS